MPNRTSASKNNNNIMLYTPPIPITGMSSKEKNATFPNACHLLTEMLVENGNEIYVVHASTTNRNSEPMIDEVKNSREIIIHNPLRVCLQKGPVLEQELMTQRDFAL